MIKKLLLSVFALGTMQIFAQNFSVMYPFTSVSSSTAGNTGTLDPTPSPTATGLSFSSFSAVGTPTDASASGAFCFDTWDQGAMNGNNLTFTGSVNPAKYYMVTLTPNVSATVSINSIMFNVSRSSTGPRHWVVRGSADTYSNNLPASIVANPNLSVVPTNVFFWSLDTYTVTSGKQEAGNMISRGASYSAQTSPMSFRWYPYDAESTAGTFRLDTVIFNGTNHVMVGLNKVTTDLNAKFTLYPNPSTDGIVTIAANSEFEKVEVLNILGAVISTENGVEGNKIKMDLGSLPAGTYFVRVSNGNKSKTEKLIISK
jgi:hypothetical protein